MSAEFPTEAEPEIGFTTKFQFFTNLARRHFHAGRGGRAKLAITTSLVSRVITTATSFVILPISVRYLGNEGYGLLATITSVVGWLQFTNMGVGLGLQNALTEETARGNFQAQRELISTAFFSLLAIGAILAIAGLVAFPYINWLSVFPPTTGRFVAEIPWAVLTVFVGLVSTIILGFVNPIYAARQELHIASVQATVTSVMTLLGTFAAVYFNWGLLGLTLCTIGATGVMQWSFALWTLYGRGLVQLHPSLGKVNRKSAGRIYSNGISFFLLQLCNIAFFQIDAFLIAHFLTVNQVTPYSVAQKVFLQTSGIFAIVTGSLWAAYGNANAKGDYAWIQATHRKMRNLFLLVYSGLGLFMIVVGHRLLQLWVGTAAAPSTLLIAAVAAYFVARDWTALHAMLLNGLNIVRPQVWNLGLTALLALTFDLLLIRRLGSIGLAVGGFVAFAMMGAWYLPYLVRTSLRQDAARLEVAS